MDIQGIKLKLLSDRTSLHDKWAYAMRSGYNGLRETTYSSLYRLQTIPKVKDAMRDVDKGVDYVMEAYFPIPDIVFGEDTYQFDPYKEIFEALPIFIENGCNPNCLGRALIIASLYGKSISDMRFVEVLRDGNYKQLKANLEAGAKSIPDNKVFRVPHPLTGEMVDITGKLAKKSMLEHLLYLEYPHGTIKLGENLLDPVEQRSGIDVGIEYNAVDGLAVFTANALGMLHLFNPRERFNTDKELERFYKELLGIAPDSYALRSGLWLVYMDRDDLKGEMKMCEEMESILSKNGVDAYARLAASKASVQSRMGNKAAAKQTINDLRERYILPDSLEIISESMPFLKLLDQHL